MEVYLKPLDSEEYFRFPLTPDRISVNTGASTLSFNIMNLGDVELPRGTTLTSYAWQGVLPGEDTANSLHLYDWQEPSDIVKQLVEWQENGTVLTLLVTELSINTDVFIKSFTYEYYGVDECSYDITLNTYFDISATLYENVAEDDGGEALKGTEAQPNQKVKVLKDGVKIRSGPGKKYDVIGTLNKGDIVWTIEMVGNWRHFVYDPAPDGYAWHNHKYSKIIRIRVGKTHLRARIKKINKATKKNWKGNTYTVKKGDTLYTIAKSQLGDGTRYRELYMLNKENIDKMNKGRDVSRYQIYVNLILKLPSTETAATTS